jgi:hypothetical protein
MARGPNLSHRLTIMPLNSAKPITLHIPNEEIAHRLSTFDWYLDNDGLLRTVAKYTVSEEQYLHELEGFLLEEADYPVEIVPVRLTPIVNNTIVADIDPSQLDTMNRKSKRIEGLRRQLEQQDLAQG